MIVATLVSTLSSGPVQAVQWNGYGNQFNYRMTGGDRVYYWYHGSAFSNSYSQAFDYALLGWSQPRVNGATSPATRCTPYNDFAHTYEPNISNATVEFYALWLTGERAGYNGYAAHYRGSRPNEALVDPDVRSYNWGQVVLNTRLMDSRPVVNGAGSKRAVASHELGHVLGLAHWQVGGTVMAQEAPFGTPLRNVSGPTCQDNNSLRVRW